MRTRMGNPKIIIQGKDIDTLHYLILNAQNSLRTRVLQGKDKEVLDFASDLLHKINKIRREQDGIA
jgi:hypothetical protein